MVLIRHETARDARAVRQIVRAAFGQPDEAELVDRLRGDGDSVMSLVAEHERAAVGHIMFSRMQAPMRALGLAPLSVLPAWQGCGIGGALVRAGLLRAREDGCDVVFVLGDPGYYGRFGFAAEAAAGFDCAYAGAYLQGLMLRGAGLPRTGRIAYAPAFSALT